MTATQRRKAPAASPPPVTGPVDPRRWPEIAVVPHRPARAAIARQLFRRAVARVPLRVVEGDADWYGGGTGADPVMRLGRPAAVFPPRRGTRPPRVRAAGLGARPGGRRPPGGRAGGRGDQR